MQPSTDPVWILFRRRTFSSLAYWCLALGFDMRDRSVNNRFYFIYFCAFWLAWILAVLTLLGSALAGVFKSLPAGSSLPALVILFGAFLLAVWGLVQLWQVTGRSPFIFGESDAFLLCQAPVRRRSVGLAWFLMDWFGTVLPFAAGAILVSFALVETALPHTAGLQDLPAYFIASLRALAIILPLQLGLQAGLWGLGAYRLRRDQPPKSWPWLHLAIFPLALGLLATVFLPGWGAIILAPLTILLQAAFSNTLSLSAWLVRAGLGLLVMALGLVNLLVWGNRMHLGRAAQETRLQSNIRLAHGIMNFELAGILKHQSRMKATRSPSRLPVRNGVWMLAWKDLIQSWRSLRTSQVLRWIWIFFLGLGIFLAPNWVVRLIVGGIWAVSLGGLAANRMRNDLARWWLLRSLPLRDADLLLVQLGPACGMGCMLGWLALALANLPAPTGWLAAMLLPFLVSSAALGAARDILDHAEARVLMTPGLAEENVPKLDIQGVFTILMSVGLPLGILTWGISHPGGLALALLSLPVSVLITGLNFKSTLSAYRWIM
jgi:hypothetical protein